MREQRQDQKISTNLPGLRYLISIAIPLFGVAVLLSSCGGSRSDIALYQEELDIPDMLAEDYVMTYTDSAKVIFRLTTPLMVGDKDIDENSYTEFPKGFFIEKFDSNGDIIQQIYADYGKDYTEEKKMDARGNVVVVNIDGDSLYTEHLVYFKDREEIFSDVYVKIVQQDRVITGIGMKSDIDFKKRVIYQTGIEQWVETEGN